MVKQYASENSDISNIKAAIITLETSLKSDKDKLSRMESQYTSVASDRLNKRLREGVDIRKAETNQRQLTTAEAKKDRLEEEFDAKIEALKDKKERMIAEYDGKIEVLKAKKRTELEGVDSTISYFKPIVNKYYESAPEVIVSYPPSYYGLKESIEISDRQLTMWKNTLLSVLEQNVIAAPSPADIARDKERAKAIAEDNARAIEAEARQREEEGRINLERKAAFRAEEERVKQKRPTNTLVIKEDPRKVAIRLAQMKATEEYRDSNGIRDMDCEINDSTSVEEDEDEDLLGDYNWATERGLQVPEGILRKLKERKLI